MDNTIVLDYMDGIITWALSFAPKLVLAILILIAGMWMAKKLARMLYIGMQNAKLDQEILGFLNSMVSIMLKFIVVLVAASTIGFEVSSLLGILAGAVFAIGLALQGFLGNFASGITIVFFKPYKVGDWVEVSGSFGKVDSIQIFSTHLITPGNKTLIIPNGQVTDNIITNFSTEGKIRLELEVTMPYVESFQKVKDVIAKSLSNFPLILEQPEPLIGIERFDSHNVVVSVRPYIHPDHYWSATFETLERIKKAFHEAGIEVAYSEGVELGKIGD